MKRLTHTFFFLFMLIAMGCGRPVRDVGEFEAYLSSFEKDAARFGYYVQEESIRIRFEELPANKLGVCTLGIDIPTIAINPTHWKTRLTEDQKTLVIYHELGHCILRRDHDNTSLNQPKQRIKDSIMNSHPLDNIDFAQYRDDYLRELFTSELNQL